MVTELMINIKVITLTKARGRLVCPAPGNALNTTLGSAHTFCEKRMVPYEIRNAPNVKASLIRKYHIISLPYSTLNGLLPPFHQFVFVAAAVVAIFNFKFLVTGNCSMNYYHHFLFIYPIRFLFFLFPGH